MISSAQTRYTIQTLEASTRFSHPVGGLGCSSLYMVVWLVGWAVGEVVVGGMLLNGLFQFLAGSETAVLWTLGGGFALYTVLLQIVGREVIEVSHDAIKIAKKVFGLGFGKTYNAINIDNLRVDESLPQIAAATTQLPPFLGRLSQGAFAANGALVFDYGGGSVHFGVRLQLDEARQLLEEILRRYPQYRSPAAG